MTANLELIQQETPGCAKADQVTLLNYLIESFYTPYFKNRVGTDAQNMTWRLLARGYQDKAIICMTESTGTNIRVMDMFKELTADLL